MPAVSEHSGEVGGRQVFWRAAEGPPDAAPTLYVHGVPSSSEELLPFLEQTGGIAPDLPGFGRSDKPDYLRYTIAEYIAFFDAFLDALGVERVRLAVHDWGAVGLAWAARRPQRIERVVAMNAVPLLPGYEWHRAARIWRTPLLGELMMGMTTRRTLRRATRPGNVRPLPESWFDNVFAHFDQGTQRAILRLYRSSPPDVLAASGAGLGALDAPALVVWGERDPYIPTRFARAYADTLGGELQLLPEAGHWWWLDEPAAIARVADFLTS